MSLQSHGVAGKLSLGSESWSSWRALVLNTLAFCACFAIWTLNGVLVTYLVENNVFAWDEAQIGWLLATPILSGSLIRLPLGMWTDRYGGRLVFPLTMLVAAASVWALSFANSYEGFLLCSLGFGLAGGGFAVGIAHTSLFFKRENQGTALGIFGAGNAGAALTTTFAPVLLIGFTNHNQNVDGWRQLPVLYAVILAAVAVAFFLGTENRKVSSAQTLTLSQRLAPLGNMRVWRFGLYYFFVFGGFVALAQWLVPYYVNVYGLSLAMAGLLASVFSLPSGLIRGVGGWLSDLFGARSIMYRTFILSLLCCVLLCVPRMQLYTPGAGVMAAKSGVVATVTPESVMVGPKTYKVHAQVGQGFELRPGSSGEGFMLLPTFESWQSPVVHAGDAVKKKQLLASGVTRIFFQANLWVFTLLVLVLGIVMGIGKAAVYRYIPDYFPKDVGVVGGMVGVIGGLGGFVCPVIFGYLLKSSGLWTSCWFFFTFVVLLCLAWLHRSVQRLMRDAAPALAERMELSHGSKA